MKLRTSALALAVAGIMAAPMAVQAESGFSGSMRLGVQMNGGDNDADKTLTFRDVGSRYRFAGENDMGNGMTSFAKIELGMGPNTREHVAGVKGDFGQVSIMGDTATVFKSFTVSPTDVSWWNGGHGYLKSNDSNNAIEYRGGAGAVSYGVTLLADGSDKGLSGNEVAASFDAGPVTIGLGMSKMKAEDDNVTSIAITGAAGDFGYGVTLQKQGDDKGTMLMGTMGNFYATIGDTEVGGDKASGLTLGYTQGLGKGTTMYYEYTSNNDKAADHKTSTILAVLKVDWK